MEQSLITQQGILQKPAYQKAPGSCQRELRMTAGEEFSRSVLEAENWALGKPKIREDLKTTSPSADFSD